MAEKEEDLIEKLSGRDLIYPLAIGKKVNELIDKINVAIIQEKTEKEENKDNEQLSS